MYDHFQTLINFYCQLFLFWVKMVDRCDKPVSLGNSVFDEHFVQLSYQVQSVIFYLLQSYQ